MNLENIKKQLIDEKSGIETRIKALEGQKSKNSLYLAVVATAIEKEKEVVALKANLPSEEEAGKKQLKRFFSKIKSVESADEIRNMLFQLINPSKDADNRDIREQSTVDSRNQGDVGIQTKSLQSINI